ncbi:Hypothetical predicted protein [Octopus vulgaris]|uniref:Uncharacterized protein n=1 Tax=Octopus vulgaris TaxID=6645 RepID=A0AA36HIG3_OCTVU|nr:Hypothetical predicted protein [Octopus vulgaris]
MGMKEVARGDFQSGGFPLKEEPKVGHSKKLDSKMLKALFSENFTVTTRELAEQLNMAHTIGDIHNYA